MRWQLEQGNSDRLAERSGLLQEFLVAVFQASDVSFLISDATTLSGLAPGIGALAVHHCAMYYGVLLGATDFDLPLWQLLDHLRVTRQT